VFNRLPGNFVNWTHVKEVVHVFAVELQELYLYFELAKLGLTLAVHKLFKDKVEHSRDNADLVSTQAHCATCAHSMRFTRPGLTISQDGCVVAREAAQN
jgi:hypothetical protein